MGRALCTTLIHLTEMRPKLPDTVDQPIINIDGNSKENEALYEAAATCHDVIVISYDIHQAEKFLEDHAAILKGSPPGKYAFIMLEPVNRFFAEKPATSLESIRKLFAKRKGFVSKLNHLLIMRQNTDFVTFGAFARKYLPEGLVNVTMVDFWSKSDGFLFDGINLFHEKLPNILNGRKLGIVIARKEFKPISFKTGRITPAGYDEYIGYEVKELYQNKITQEKCLNHASIFSQT